MRRLAPLVLLLVACAPAAPRTAPPPARVEGSPALLPLAAELREIVRRRGGDTLEVSVALHDLESGDSLLVDGHVPMHAASTMKVPVMFELFRRAAEGGLSLDDSVAVRNRFRSIADGSGYSLSPEDDSERGLYALVGRRLPLRELVRRMITRSSNLATNLLIEIADPDSIRASLARVGASEMKVLRGVEDGPAYERGLNNTTTAYGLMKSLEAVAASPLVPAAARQEMLAILRQQEFSDMIPAGLPPGTPVGNKTGWITGIQHDGAIVLPPGRAPYVLVVLTRGFRDRAAAAATGRDISRAVWERVTR